MALKIITPPTTEPISLQEAKRHLRVDIGDEDDYISSLIKKARSFAETTYTWRSLAIQTLEYTLDKFPVESFIKLPRPPLKTVESIIYKDKDGAETTLDSSVYIVDMDNEPGKIVLASNQSWPMFEPYPVNAVRIRYKAGYDSLPEEIKQAMLLLIGHWYENREAAYIGNMSHELSFAVESLLIPYRVWG